MTAELTLYFENTDDLTRILQLLKESGLEALMVKKGRLRKKAPKPEKRTWAFGIGKLGGKLDQINLRDFAYEN
ncbi:MAG: hypothetical protein Q7T20_11070 [Saprospiraceae bacterium]|nr:hypothetical protein [Saprospiraceae bacterium]